MSVDLAYAELGLPPGASEPEVRAAWRRLVSRWHPDRNTSADAVDLMQRINSAYERIRQAAFTGGTHTEAPDSASDAPAPSTSRPEEAPGRKVHRKVRLSLEEAALGCTKVVRGKLTVTCTACEGQGLQSPPAPCARCDGVGTVRASTWFGWLAATSACEACGGSGVSRQVCSPCEGRGKSAMAYRRTVRLPAGVRQGDVLSAGAAGSGHGSFDGTLELHIEISAHKFFVSGEDATLRCEMPVDGFAWIANAWIEVPTLTGMQKMRLQRGRHVYRLRGQGLPLERRGIERGDYLVTVVPSFPDVLSEHQQAVLDQLASTSAGPQGQGAAPAIRAWKRAVDAWERGRPGR